MFLINSRLGHFSAATQCKPEKTHNEWRPFSRSYGAILPSSLRRDHSSALVFSTHLPVSVYGTDTFEFVRGFSWQHGINHFTAIRLRPIASGSLTRPGGFAYQAPLAIGTCTSSRRMVYPIASPHHSNTRRWCRNIDLLPFAYAFRPQLRIRLTLGGLTFPRKPWIFGG